MATRGDRFAQVTGFLVFVLGLAIIVGVLWAGFQLWRSPTLGIAGPGPGQTPDVTSIGLGFGRLLVRILLLFLGSVCGSLIANKGVRLYFAGIPSPQPNGDSAHAAGAAAERSQHVDKA